MNDSTSPADIFGSLANFLKADSGGNARFPCRPLVARTAERNTALGCFQGQIGLLNLKEFKDALGDLASENLSKVILDFAGVSLSKSAVGALVDFAASMHGRRKRLYLYRCAPQIRAMLKELGLTAFFSYMETEDDVIASIV